MNDSKFRATLIALGVFLVPAALVIGAMVAGWGADNQCSLRVASSTASPGLMPHAIDLQC